MNRVGHILGIVGGSICVALGVAGILLPLLPTTPFLLLAAALFLRSSPRLHARLLNNRWLGVYIRSFQVHRAIPLRAKIVSVALLWATLLWCICCVVDAWWWAQVLLLGVAVGVTRHILSYATLRRSGRNGEPMA